MQAFPPLFSKKNLVLSSMENEVSESDVHMQEQLFQCGGLSESDSDHISFLNKADHPSQTATAHSTAAACRSQIEGVFRSHPVNAKKP